MARRIGLDFDNTIVCYDAVFLAVAKAWSLLEPRFQGSKQDVRDAIRLLPDGELSWQKLQGYVYGKGIGGAHAFDGLLAFLARAKAKGDTLLIVSHKTEFGHFDPDRTNLREAARSWMAEQKFFAADGFAIAAENVHFAATRAEKLRRIAAVGCDVFIDDLEEVLGDPDFPTGVERILFSNQSPPVHAVPYKVLPTWPEIEAAVFDD